MIYLAGRVSNQAATSAGLAQFQREDQTSGSILRSKFPDGVQIKADPAEALRWNTAAAEAGHAGAQARLGYQYAAGLGVARDYDQAVRWLEAAASTGDELGTLCLGALYAGGHGDPPRYEKAVPLFQALAQTGNAAGAFNLGVLTLRGQGIAADPAQAEELFRLSAGTGHLAAMHQLGVLLAGRGATDPVAKRDAETWLRRAAGRGHVPAQVMLGRLCADGVAGSLDEAASLFRDAAEQGSGEACHLLGQLAALGRGVPLDREEALRWFVRAVERGHAPAMGDLLGLRAAGFGQGVDLTGAVERLRQAVANGDPVATYYLALALLDGDEPDPPRAVELLAAASSAGIAAAASRLGVLYAAGEVVAQDYAEAARWYEISGRAGDNASVYNLAFLHLRGLAVAHDAERAVGLLSGLADRGFLPAAEALFAQYQSGEYLAPDPEKARAWLQRAASLGSTEAARIEARERLERGGTETDRAAARVLLERAAASGDINAQIELGRFLQFGVDGEKPDMMAAQAWMERAAGSGSAEALAWLGDVHRQQLTEKSRPDVAEQYYRLAIERGHIGAMLMLAQLKSRPGYSQDDLAEAVELWRRAAELGDLDGKRNYGGCLLQGIVVPRDFDAGYALITEAATGGNVAAQLALGVFHTVGGWPQSNPAEAPPWFRRAAETGNADGQYNLGVCYRLGLGVEADMAEAERWYRLAAAQGLPSARLALADLLLQRSSGEDDDVEAAGLYESVADIYPAAPFTLGKMRRVGRGVEQNLDMALTDIRRAAERGYEPAVMALRELETEAAG
jgi:TPR repeat protein